MRGNQEFKVRLSRTSSAQAVLKKERRKSVLHKQLDDIIDDERSTDTVTGKLPVEAAYVIMKRVTEEVGQPLNSAGRSTFNKLQSLKTTPAVDLLMQKTWREFFSKKTAHHSTMAKQNNGGENDSNKIPTDGNSLRGSAEDLQLRQNEMKVHLSRTFERLVARVETLWTNLKIPTADRVFYRKTLCKGPPQSVEQCREVATYILTLKAHQEATMAVIHAIQMREMSIAKCFDVLAALQRKFSRNSAASSGYSNLNSTQPSPLQSSRNFNNATDPNRFNFTNASDTQQQQQQQPGRVRRAENNGTTSFWKEELITILDDVRVSSLEVVRLIQRWRRNLWRPHPFVYMGVNYLAKMKDDLGILESDMYVRLLALVPLRLSDLQCIIFFSDVGKIYVDAVAAKTLNDTINGFDNGNVNGMSGVASLRIDSGTRSPPEGGGGGSSGDPVIDQMLSDFHHRVNARELQMAASVVLEEEVLQNALSIEQASLLQKGVFIPTLHTSAKGDQERVVSRTISHQSHLNNSNSNAGTMEREGAVGGNLNTNEGFFHSQSSSQPQHYPNYGTHNQFPLQQTHQQHQQQHHPFDAEEFAGAVGGNMPSISSAAAMAVAAVEGNNNNSVNNNSSGNAEAEEIDWAPDFSG